MIANFHSGSELNDYRQEVEPDHTLSLEFQLTPPNKNRLQCEAAQSQPEQRQKESGEIDCFEEQKVAMQLSAMGYRAGQLDGIINRQLQSVKSLHSLQISKERMEQLQKESGIDSPIKGKKNGYITRQSSNLTVLEQNNKVQSYRISQISSPKSQCTICFVNYGQVCSEGCDHNFCQGCLANYVRQLIIDGVFIFVCPSENCKETISLQTVQNLLEQNQMERFVYFYQKNVRQSDPNNKFCSSPNCGKILQINDSKLYCKQCKINFCSTCLQHEHQGIDCDIALMKSLEQTFESYKIKKCPHCRSPIEKQYGCNHICCRQCKHEFCWICLKKYTHFHYRYYNCFGCPGMQFENENSFIMMKMMKVTLFLIAPFIILLMLLCYLAVVPIYMSFNLFFKPFSWIYNRCQFMEAVIIEKGFFFLLYFDFGDFVCSFFLWVFYQPRALIFAVFVSPVRLGFTFGEQIVKFFQ